ncbi:MAG: beta-ketoacyl-ACP synthase 3 [Solirubrobacteraceae bacterium]
MTIIEREPNVSAPASFRSRIRTGATATGAALASVAVSLPEQIVGNAEVAERFGVEASWIERRTGIRQRRIAGPEDRLDQHAAIASRLALKQAGIKADALDLVLVATTTADELLPNAAPLVAHAIGAVRAGAFDVGAACTGFLSALAVGSAQIEAGRARAVLVVGADFMSRITNPLDRGTAAVFADGAGAAVMVATDAPTRIGPVILGADGDGAPYIVVEREERLIQMAGHETFKEAVARLSLATLQAAAAAEVTLEEIDLFVYHQANSRILAAVGERLALPNERIVDCIGEYGNTSAATLPLALAHAQSHGLLRDGTRVLLGAFGAGFTWGGTVVEWGAAV